MADGAVKYSAGVLTVSDAGSRGQREDLSGARLAERLTEAGFDVVRKVVVPDDAGAIAQVLIEWCQDDLALVITTGGTGFAPRDVTPEATASVVERQADSLAEYIRWSAYSRIPRAALSRGMAGIRGRTLIINLPGSPKAVDEGMDAALPLLPHALALIRGEWVDH